ncbi:GGDEF domain-containing protein [Alishewanella sp. HL-SH06]|uniref:GGDEF domain-containing protein n=1 Tax=Alishewanella sp. HL-SH06 TaxID=3461144 RepID=UPI00404316C6
MDILTLNYVNLFLGIAASFLLILLYKQNKQLFLLYWFFASSCLWINSTIGIFSRSGFDLPYWLNPAIPNTCYMGIYLFLLAGLYEQTQRKFKVGWLLAIVILTYAINLTELAQASSANRLLLNLPISIVLNVMALRLLIRQKNRELRAVYICFSMAFLFNIIQLCSRYILFSLDLSGIFTQHSSQIMIGLGYFAITAFSLLTFGSCLYLVYRQQHIALQHIADRDALTGVFNRWLLNEKLQTELQRSQRLKQCCSLVMLDIDHFKQVNDLYGHVAGDRVIAHIAYVAQSELRGYDSIFRYGGEEFLICLPNTDSQAALHIAERIRIQVEQSCAIDCQQAKATVSVGVSTYTDGKPDWQHLITQADNALYQAKKQGRNQTQHYQHLVTQDL